MFQIVETDNHDGDYPDESFQLLPMEKVHCEAIANIVNSYVGDSGPRFYKVVELPYKLQPGFGP